MVNLKNWRKGGEDIAVRTVKQMEEKEEKNMPIIYLSMFFFPEARCSKENQMMKEWRKAVLLLVTLNYGTEEELVFNTKTLWKNVKERTNDEERSRLRTKHEDAQISRIRRVVDIFWCLGRRETKDTV